jgi:hypothetical protein
MTPKLSCPIKLLLAINLKLSLSVNIVPAIEEGKKEWIIFAMENL